MSAVDVHGGTESAAVETVKILKQKPVPKRTRNGFSNRFANNAVQYELLSSLRPTVPMDIDVASPPKRRAEENGASLRTLVASHPDWITVHQKLIAVPRTARWMSAGLVRSSGHGWRPVPASARSGAQMTSRAPLKLASMPSGIEKARRSKGQRREKK